MAPETVAARRGRRDAGAARSSKRMSSPLQKRTAAITARSACDGTSLAKYPPTNAPATDGGVIQATIRQLTRPARACVSPPVNAAAALTAMFVPAAAAGLPEARSTAGSRRLPSTSPTSDPSAPAANDPANASTSSSALIGDGG